MKKIFVILGMLILTVIVLSIPEYEITKSGTTLLLSMKNYKVTLDDKGHILEFEIKNDRFKFVKVFVYTNDSFNIFDGKNEILPSDFKYEKNPDYIEFIYDYNGEGSKVYKFFNDPYFHFEVHIKGFTGKEISLPSISYPVTIRVKDNLMLSYIKSPTPAVLVISSKSNIEKSYKVKSSFKEDFLVYLGPSKSIYIKELFGKELYSTIKELLKEVKGLSIWGSIIEGFAHFLWYLYKFTKNFGLAIIIFTFVIRFVLYPLYHKQTESIIKMREIQPELEKIKRKYKDPRKQQEEMMKLYKEKGMNPAGGCLTALIQLPIFIILWDAIRYFMGFYPYAPRFLLWQDLSVGGFGANIILVLISVIAYIWNALLSSQDARTAWQSILMSVIFPFILINFPSGVFLYYATNAIIQVVITFYVNRRYGVKGITLRDLLGLGPKPIRR